MSVPEESQLYPNQFMKKSKMQTQLGILSPLHHSPPHVHHCHLFTLYLSQPITTKDKRYN